MARPDIVEQARVRNMPFGHLELIDKLADEIERLRKDGAKLSQAYLRLRSLIPGAFDTPHAPSPEQVWDVTERALKRALTGRGGHDGDHP